MLAKMMLGSLSPIMHLDISRDGIQQWLKVEGGEIELIVESPLRSTRILP